MDNVSPKKRLVALLLCFFFGCLGIHRFYAGRVGTGLIQLGFTLTFFGLIVSSVWALVDLILIAAGSFKDKNGLVIKQWTND